MRKLIFIGLLLWSIRPVWAQMSVDETEFKGKKYKVYPVRLAYDPMEYSGGWRYASDYSTTKHIKTKQLM
jgi:hypothetical protein